MASCPHRLAGLGLVTRRAGFYLCPPPPKEQLKVASPQPPDDQAESTHEQKCARAARCLRQRQGGAARNSSQQWPSSRQPTFSFLWADPCSPGAPVPTAARGTPKPTAWPPVESGPEVWPRCWVQSSATWGKKKLVTHHTRGGGGPVTNQCSGWHFLFWGNAFFKKKFLRFIFLRFFFVFSCVAIF